MATYTVASAPGRTGLDLTSTATAVASSDNFTNDGATHLAVINGSGAPITVTFSFNSNVAVDGVVPSNPTASVAAGDTEVFGPFATNFYNDTTGKLTVGYSSITTVKAKAYKAR
jgi:hypothetical protein